MPAKGIGDLHREAVAAGWEWTPDRKRAPGHARRHRAADDSVAVRRGAAANRGKPAALATTRPDDAFRSAWLRGRHLLEYGDLARSVGRLTLGVGDADAEAEVAGGSAGTADGAIGSQHQARWIGSGRDRPVVWGGSSRGGQVDGRVGQADFAVVKRQVADRQWIGARARAGAGRRGWRWAGFRPDPAGAEGRGAQG